jgi:putative nucleotidyltransferase with HDIG domain
MTRDEAIALVKRRVSKGNLVKHMLASGACMRALALELDGDPDLWELVGVLHDLDYDETADDVDRHGLRTVEILKEEGIEDTQIFDAVLAHVGKKDPETPMERAIYAVDPTTGFIVACALMHPTKHLSGLDLEFIRKRFKDKRFAAGASRDQMRASETLGLSLDGFLTTCLTAMQRESEALGL